MSGAERRQRLLDVLATHIFGPILQVPLDRVDRSEAIEDAQCRTGELDRVGLPTLTALRGQFLALCDEIGLGTGERPAAPQTH